MLAVNYIILTAVLLAVTLGGYLLWTRWSVQAFEDPDIPGLLRDRSLLAEQFASVPVSKYLGREGALTILNGVTVAFGSDASFRPSLTEGELSCIPVFNGGSVQTMEYLNEKGEKRYLVTSSPDPDSESVPGRMDLMILDAQYRVLSGKTGTGDRLSYTKEEFDYLTGRWSDRYLLYRSSLTTLSGNKFTLLVRVPAFSVENYRQSSAAAASRIVLLLIPLYFLFLMLSILWLHRKIRIPLKKLDTAVTKLGEGESVQASECGGPQEISDIGRNFDAMQKKITDGERKRKELEENRQKILADISHDLKTPVTVVSGYAKALKDGKVKDGEVPEYLQLIARKTDELTYLINTFYEYNKVEHPAFRISGRRMDLCEYLREYLSAKYSEIELAGFGLDADIPEEEIPCLLDPVQFQRVLDNILANAFRYNAGGTLIICRVRCNEDTADILIADNGKGIPENIRDHIFEAFMVGEQSRRSGGSGLGLSIAKKIVEEHHGTIVLAGPPPGTSGTWFRVSLPVQKC